MSIFIDFTHYQSDMNYTYIYTYTGICVRVFIYRYLSLCVRVGVCVCVRGRVCVCVQLCAQWFISTNNHVNFSECFLINVIDFIFCDVQDLHNYVHLKIDIYVSMRKYMHHWNAIAHTNARTHTHVQTRKKCSHNIHTHSYIGCMQCVLSR